LNGGTNVLPSVGGEEEGRCGYGIDVFQGGISQGGACPLAGGAHGGGQYPRPEAGGGVLKLWPGWPVGGGGGRHVEACSVAGVPPHDITCVGPI
jgi:hypothetical protein